MIVEGVCVYDFVYVSVCVREREIVCACVWVREREKEREKERGVPYCVSPVGRVDFRDELFEVCDEQLYHSLLLLCGWASGFRVCPF